MMQTLFIHPFACVGLVVNNCLIFYGQQIAVLVLISHNETIITNK